MKAALISLRSVSSKWIAEAMKKYFEEVDDLDLKEIEVNLASDKLEVLYQGKPLKDYDCVYAKGSFRYETLLGCVSSALYNKCYMPIRPTAFTIGHNKLLTHIDLQKNKVPMPKTYLASTPVGAKKILAKIHYPVIMKFPKGTQGKGVMYAESFAAASSLLDALTELKQPFIIQEYVETEGVDIRALVVGDDVIASMKRKAEKGEKRANIHAGGVGEAYRLSNEAKKIAVEAAKAVEADICAVDMLEGIKGPLVLEVNISPGLQEITKVTKIDVADKIAGFLYKKAEEFSEKMKGGATKKIMKDLAMEKAGKLDGIITNLEFRGNRVLLPQSITNITKFNDKDEVTLSAEKGKLVVSDFKLGKKRDD